MATAEKRGIRGLADRANPAFAVGAVVVPVGALAYALTLGDLRTLFYVHVMAGVLWTGVDVFMGAILGPVLGGLDPEEKASVFARFTPKMTFSMPVMATVTITGGIELAKALGYGGRATTGLPRRSASRPCSRYSDSALSSRTRPASTAKSSRPLRT